MCPLEHKGEQWICISHLSCVLHFWFVQVHFSWVLSCNLRLCFFHFVNLHYTEINSLDRSAQSLIPTMVEDSTSSLNAFCFLPVYWFSTEPLLQSGFFFCWWPTRSSKFLLPVKALPLWEVHCSVVEQLSSHPCCCATQTLEKRKRTFGVHSITFSALKGYFKLKMQSPAPQKLQAFRAVEADWRTGKAASCMWED